jgi:signal transduction histidine kinase
VCELPEWEYDARSSTQLYRIAQEATSNAIRHARARRIRITMEKERDDILLMIEDDGMGLSDDLPANQGMGLQTMRYRAGMLGGTLEMHSGQDGGTRVVCRIPASLRFSAPPTAKKKATRCRRKS